MKTRNFAILIAVCFVMVTMFAPMPAMSAQVSAEAQVVLVGQWANGAMTIMLTQVPSGFTNKAFSVTGAQKEIMAILLTAVSCNKNVTVIYDDAVSTPPIIGINLAN